jgi:class 3 adenylate cyclase
LVEQIGTHFMAEARVERRLAAILAADVAGYSRMMGSDEEGTLAALKACRRELVDPKIAEHRGRIVKTTGDGLLIEFPSVVEAVTCALAVQRGMVERNAGVPEDQRIEFRIGINLGDIIIDEGDIYGDGVNVAARLEGLAEPGGFASAPRRMSRCATACTSPSTISASSRSRTSQGPCAPMLSPSAHRPAQRCRPLLRCRSRTSRLSLSCRSRT